MKGSILLDKRDTSAELPDDIKTAQRRVRRAVCTLPPPGAFSVLIEQLAQEMAHAGIGVELDEEIEAPEAAPVKAPRWKFWRAQSLLSPEPGIPGSRSCVKTLAL